MTTTPSLDGFFGYGCPLPKNEADALDHIAALQEVQPAQILRRALEHYARSALPFDEYRAFYPLDAPDRP
jgi:hypothetical protein